MEPQEPSGNNSPRAPDGPEAGVSGPSGAWDMPDRPSQAPTRPGTLAWTTAGLALLAIAAIVALVVVAVQLNDTRSDLDRSEEEVASLEDDKRDLEFERATFRAERDEAQQERDEHSAEADEADQGRAELEALMGRVFVETLSLEFPEDRALLSCILDEIGAVTAGQLMLLSLEPDTIDFSELRVAVEFVDAYEDCGGDPADLGESPSSGGTGGSGEIHGPGDDSELDALYDACAGGDMVACDELYFASPLASEYERFGLTCGDRVDDLGFDEYCVDYQVPA